jgi:hypothetical protein
MREASWLAGSAITLADLHTAPMLALFRMAPEGQQILDSHRRLARMVGAHQHTSELPADPGAIQDRAGSRVRWRRWGARREITDQSSIKPSSTKATPNPQSSAPFSSQRSSQNHPRLQPLRRQIPIVARRSPPSRGFVHRRLSDAGPYTGSIARAGPASETLPDLTR